MDKFTSKFQCGSKNALCNLIILILLSFCVTTPIKAQESTQMPELKNQRKLQIEQKKAEQQAQKTINLGARCEKSSESLNNLAENYSRNRSKLFEISNKSITNLTNVISRAKRKGRDTSATEAALTVYQEKVKAADAEFEKLIALVNATKQYSCMESSKEYKASLEATRMQLKKTIQSMQTVKKYFSNTLKTAAIHMKEVENQ